MIKIMIKIDGDTSKEVSGDGDFEAMVVVIHTHI